MAAATASTSLIPVQPVFTESERLALAGFLAGYRGLTCEAYTLDLRQFTGWCRARSLPLFSVRRADIETFARELEARGRARATVTRRLCTIAGFYKYAVEEETPGPLARGARPSSPAGLRVARHRAGRQRTRRPPGRCRARTTRRARADLPACAERAAGIRGHRRGHRAPGPGARAPDPGHHPKGRQGRHHPPRPAHRQGDRPGDRRAHRRTPPCHRGRQAAGPARRRPDRPPGHPARRDRQGRQPAHTAARFHHQFRRWGPAARRAGGCLPRRPAHHHALRPRADQPGPARHLHRRHLHSRSSEVAPRPRSQKSVWAPVAARPTAPQTLAEVITGRSHRQRP